MFYIGKMAVIALCWLFYMEYRWMLERRVLAVCSRSFVRKRCRTFFDKLFFVPLSGKAKLKWSYYMNIAFFFVMAFLTAFHLLFGWIEPLHGFINVLTSVLLVTLGLCGAACSAGNVENLCVNHNVMSKRMMLLLEILMFAGELIVILACLYVTWVWIV